MNYATIPARHLAGCPTCAEEVSTGGAVAPQQRLYFRPEWQGQGALRGIAEAATGGWTAP